MLPRDAKGKARAGTLRTESGESNEPILLITKITAIGATVRA
jgi:hypothetical protein